MSVIGPRPYEWVCRHCGETLKGYGTNYKEAADWLTHDSWFGEGQYSIWAGGRPK